eukprot:m.283802 g.283802  ORF g.283802 m.283802 type:complete len:137 (-) comp11120_c0_seq5:4006-4416(-)
MPSQSETSLSSSATLVDPLIPPPMSAKAGNSRAHQLAALTEWADRTMPEKVTGRNLARFVRLCTVQAWGMAPNPKDSIRREYLVGQVTRQRLNTQGYTQGLEQLLVMAGRYTHTYESEFRYAKMRRWRCLCPCWFV